MKTPEEIRLAVLKECERLAPNPQEVGKIEGLSALLVNRTNEYQREKNPATWELHMSFGTILIYDDSDNLGYVYRLLNLDARELEEKSELLTKYKDDLPEIVKYIKGDKLHSEDMAASIQERAQGLVDALEEIATHIGADTMTDWVRAKNTAKTALNQWKGGGNG